MARHKSAVKRHRQSLKRRERNRSQRSTLRNAIKKALAAVQEGDAGQALSLLRSAERLIARAGKKGIIHRRNAQRKISRLARTAARVAPA